MDVKAIVLGCAVVFFDQAVKWFVISDLVNISKPYLEVRLIQSEGIFLSFPGLAGSGVVHIITMVAVLTVIGVLIGVLDRKRQRALAMVFAGGLSNAVDFIARDHIIDIIRIGSLTTNVADIAIIFGIIVLVAVTIAQGNVQE